MTLAEYRKRRGPESRRPKSHARARAVHEETHPGPLEYLKSVSSSSSSQRSRWRSTTSTCRRRCWSSRCCPLSLLKFILVVLWFMHLRFDNRIFSTAFLAGLALALVALRGRDRYTGRQADLTMKMANAKGSGQPRGRHPTHLAFLLPLIPERASARGSTHDALRGHRRRGLAGLAPARWTSSSCASALIAAYSYAINDLRPRISDAGRVQASQVVLFSSASSRSTSRRGRRYTI